jgi:hypothetical protein
VTSRAFIVLEGARSVRSSSEWKEAHWLRTARSSFFGSFPTHVSLARRERRDYPQHELRLDRCADLGVDRVVTAPERADALAGDPGIAERIPVPAQSFRASSPSS